MSTEKVTSDIQSDYIPNEEFEGAENISITINTTGDSDYTYDPDATYND